MFFLVLSVQSQTAKEIDFKKWSNDTVGVEGYRYAVTQDTSYRNSWVESLNGKTYQEVEQLFGKPDTTYLTPNEKQLIYIVSVTSKSEVNSYKRTGKLNFSSHIRLIISFDNNDKFVDTSIISAGG